MLEHVRKRIRLPEHDYSLPGYYFITICANNMDCIFGSVSLNQVVLSDLGNLVNDCWGTVPNHHSGVTLHEYVIMPNHMHSIVELNGFQKRSVSVVIGSFKSAVTKDAKRRGYRSAIWQRRFYDHVIRNEESLASIREYITDNPINWHMNKFNPACAMFGDSDPIDIVRGHGTP